MAISIVGRWPFAFLFSSSTPEIMLPLYPERVAPSLALRPLVHPLFQRLDQGISEFTFASLFLFRQKHRYQLCALADETVVILGEDTTAPFFMLPFGLPAPQLLARLFADHGSMKAVSSSQQAELARQGYRLVEDRDNFDYLYLRQHLAELPGRQFHKKRNLVKQFVQSYDFQAQPLTPDNIGGAMQVLESWRENNQEGADYEAAREALEQLDALQLCGGLYLVEETPVAYVLGEELGRSNAFVIHFEKALPSYKGIYQFINKSFASILPQQYRYINREQDLGLEGLRQAKLSYNPDGFVKKYRAYS